MSLFDAGAISRSQLDDAEMSLQVSQAGLEQQQQLLQKLRAGYNGSASDTVGQQRQAATNMSNDVESLQQQKQALDLYYDLLALKEAPMKILALISRQFNMLLQVKEMKMKGYQEQTIATQTGLNAYFLKKKYIPQASKFKLEQLQQALTACVEAEEAVKTGNMTDILSVELIIVSLSAA